MADWWGTLPSEEGGFTSNQQYHACLGTARQEGSQRSNDTTDGEIYLYVMSVCFISSPSEVCMRGQCSWQRVRESFKAVKILKWLELDLFWLFESQKLLILNMLKKEKKKKIWSEKLGRRNKEYNFALSRKLFMYWRYNPLLTPSISQRPFFMYFHQDMAWHEQREFI